MYVQTSAAVARVSCVDQGVHSVQVFVAMLGLCPQATDRDPLSFNVNAGYVHGGQPTVILRVFV